MVASGSSNHSLILWDLLEQKWHEFTGHSAAITDCCFSPNGEMLISVAEDGNIRGWDVRSPRPAFVLQGHHGAIQSCAIDPQGKRLITGAADHSVGLWDLSTAQQLGVFLGHRRPITQVAWGPAGRTVWSSSMDRTARCWSLEDLRNPDVAMNHTAAYAPAFLPRPSTHRFWLEGPFHQIWQVQNGEVVHEMHGHTGAVYDLDISESAPLLASASTDETVRLWSTETGKSIAVLQGHDAPVTCCRFLSTQQLISGGRDHKLRVWNLESLESIQVMEGHENWVRCCAVPLGWSSCTVRQL